MPSAFFDDSSITMNLKKISNSVSSWAIWKFGNGGNTSYDQKKSTKYKMSLSANALNGHIVDNGVNHTTSSSVSNLHIHRVNNNQMPSNSEQLNNNNESSCDINNSGSGVLRQSGTRPKKQPSFVSRLRHRHSLYQKGKSATALEPQVGASLCDASSTDSFNQSTNSFEFIDGGVTSFDDRASAPAHYHSQGLQQRENVGRRGDSLVLDNQGNVMSLCRSFHVASMDESLGVLSEETPATSIDKTDNAVVMVESVPSNSKSLNRSQKHEKQSRKSVRNSTSGVQQFGHLLTKLSVFANLQGERSLDTTTSNQAPANTESVISSSTNDPDQSGTFLSDLMNANWAVESEPSSMCQSSLFDEELRQLYAVNGSTLSTKPIATGSTRAFSDSHSCSVDAPNLPNVSDHAEFTGSELARRRSCTGQIMAPPSKTAISSLAAQAKYHESLDESSGASAYTSPEHATSSDVEQIDTRCASKSLSEGLSRESRPKRSVTLRVSSKQIQKIKQRFKNARSPSNTFSNLKRSQGSFSSKRSEAAKSLPRSAKSIGFQGASSVDSSDSGILVVSNAGGKMTSSMIDHGVADQYHHPGSHVQINGSGIKHSQSHAVSTAHRLRPKSEGFYSTDHLTPANNADCVPGHRQSRRERWLNHGAGGSPQMFCGKAENYEKLEKLGEGSYATVHKGFSHVHGKFVALKEIRLQAEEGTPFTAIREASLLKGLKHSNIVLLHDIIHTKDILTFVFEYVHTDLSKYLETCPSGMMPQNAKLFLYQLLRGLAFCHDRKILHRDLKPQNLLISELGELKLADFGLARAKSVPSHNYSHEVVTLWYRPPDVLLGSVDYTTSLDMWGVGCIFVEMLTGFPIFPGTRDVFDQLDRIFQVMGTPTDLYWEGVSKLPNYQTNKFGSYLPVQWSRVCPRVCKIPNAKSLVLSMLQMKPYKRVSALMSMTHPYFSDLPAQVHSLPPTSSIFIIPGVRLLPEAKTPGPYYRVAV